MFLVLAGFIKDSVTKCFGPIKFILNTERVIQLENDGDMHDNRKCIKRVNKLNILASNSFHSLNVSNQWDIPSNIWNGMSKGRGACDHCGDERYAPDLPHPCDKAKTKKAREECAACRGGGGRGSGSSGRGV